MLMEVLFATGNKHKIMEANVVGEQHDIKFVQAQVEYPEIRADKLSDVAKAGAKHVYEKLEKPVIVEDSGLFIDALKGFPGPYSKFVFDRIGCAGVIRLMAGVDDKTARFVSAIGYAHENGVEVFEGQVKGVLTGEARGDEGFGYDPIFVPIDYNLTFAQDPKHKNKISHRKIAFALLCDFLKNR